MALDFSSNWEIRGGVWRYGIELARAMVDRLGPDRVVLPVYDRLSASSRAELRATGARSARTPFANRFDQLDLLTRRRGRLVPWPRLVPLFYRPAVRERLFQSALGGARIYHALFRPRGRPRGGVTVGTIHDLIPLRMPAETPLPPQVMLSIIDDHRRWSSLIIVPSAATRDDLVNELAFSPDQLRVIHHGINPAQFSADAAIDDGLLKRYDLRPGSYFLYVGAVEQRKNIDRMVDGYLAAVGGRRDVPLILAGHGPDNLPALRRAIADGSNRVRHLGYLPESDLAGLYRGARGLIHLSLIEGFGFTPLEALSSGCPVIVARSAATAEVVGEAGVLVDATDLHSIAAGIRQVLDDDALCAQLHSTGPRHAAQFTWERCARATLAVYEEAAGGS